MELISVLMSVYREPIEYIEQAVKSILEQTYSNFEYLIVIDDPENKKAIAYLQEVEKSDNRIQLLYNDRNLGLARSLNKGLAIAKGKYIARMDADDIAVPERFEKEIEYLISKKYDLVCSLVYMMDGEGNVWGELPTFPNKQNIISRLLPYQVVIVHPTVIIKKSVMMELGGYRNFSSSQDYDLWLRLVSNQYSLGVINDKLLYFRRHEKNVTSTKRVSQCINNRYIRKMYKERKKNGTDSFSQQNLDDYFERCGYNDVNWVKEQNSKLNKYREGLKEIKKRKCISGIKKICSALTCSFVREEIKISVQYRIVKKVLSFM